MIEDQKCSVIWSRRRRVSGWAEEKKEEGWELLLYKEREKGVIESV